MGVVEMRPGPKDDPAFPALIGVQDCSSRRSRKRWPRRRETETGSVRASRPDNSYGRCDRRRSRPAPRRRSNLAPTRRVVMIERRPDIPRRIGESLVPAARRLLTDMGLWPSFEAEPHRPCYGNRAVWGTDAAGRNRLPARSGWSRLASRPRALRRLAAGRGDRARREAAGARAGRGCRAVRRHVAPLACDSRGASWTSDARAC